MKKLFNWAKNRYKNVFQDKYPKYWHLFDIILGFIMALIFVLVQAFDPDNEFTSGVLTGLFFAIWILGYLIAFAFSYGIVRARNAWTYRK